MGWEGWLPNISEQRKEIDELGETCTAAPEQKTRGMLDLMERGVGHDSLSAAETRGQSRDLERVCPPGSQPAGPPRSPLPFQGDSWLTPGRAPVSGPGAAFLTSPRMTPHVLPWHPLLVPLLSVYLTVPPNWGTSPGRDCVSLWFSLVWSRCSINIAWMDGWMDGWTDGWITDGQMDGYGVDGWPAYLSAGEQLLCFNKISCLCLYRSPRKTSLL